MNKVALIPARSKSKRIKDKNIHLIDGHPMIAYSIVSAIKSKIFDKVVCCTDSILYANIARYYGAEVPLLRPSKISGHKSSDYEWVDWIIKHYDNKKNNFDLFSILRPTSPFRLPATIQKAFELFDKNQHSDSLRAVQKVIQHPGKMWKIQNSRLVPLMNKSKGGIPWHSCQYANLPEFYSQDASLEIAWTKTLKNKKSISGDLIIPFISNYIEGFDINNPEDLIIANSLVKENKNFLVEIDVKPFK